MKWLKGKSLLDGENVLELEVDERAALRSIFSDAIPKWNSRNYERWIMRAAINAKRDEDDKISVMQFIKKLDEKMALLNMPEEMAERYLNEGFSGGGEKTKRDPTIINVRTNFCNFRRDWLWS